METTTTTHQEFGLEFRGHRGRGAIFRSAADAQRHVGRNVKADRTQRATDYRVLTRTVTVTTTAWEAV